MRQAERFVRDRRVIRKPIAQFIVPAIDSANVGKRRTAAQEIFDTAGTIASMQFVDEPQQIRMKRLHHIRRRERRRAIYPARVKK
jgi:hypothetical protein